MYIKRMKKLLLSLILSAGLLVSGSGGDIFNGTIENVYAATDLQSVPDYTGSSYTVLNDNIPEFSEEELSANSFENYSELDSLGRCGVAYASIGVDLMPTEKRGKIGQVRPSGWQTKKYDCVEGKYLYNRCHLIGYQLTAENANEKNLITGTRYMNTEGMLPFENMTADYIHETGNHVLYRVTPLYNGDDLVASGVQMEAQSVEDGGEGILFNVFCYNVQPGIGIDYSTGESWEETSETVEQGIQEDVQENVQQITYIINVNSGKFHKPSCYSVDRMKDSNKMEYTGTREELLDQGYSPCENCNP